MTREEGDLRFFTPSPWAFHYHGNWRSGRRAFMDLLSTLKSALLTLIRHKMRTALTVLGVMIGIGAVICVVAIGQAGSEQIQAQMDNLGDNFVWIEAGSRAPNGIRTGSHGTKTLVVSDVEAIVSQVPLIKAATPN